VDDLARELDFTDDISGFVSEVVRKEARFDGVVGVVAAAAILGRSDVWFSFLRMNP
jgi:hypothetical protein